MNEKSNPNILSLSRREFLASAGVAATALATTFFSNACNKAPVANKLDDMAFIANEKTADLYPIYKDGSYVIKDFSYLTQDRSLGLSKEIMENHLGLYSNYVKKVNLAETQALKGELDEATMKNLAFSLNGMALHDIYFSNMSSQNGQVSANLKKAIESSFGSWDNYFNNLIAIAEKVEGWSITAVNLLNGRIINYGLNSHSDNFPNFIFPILALDVYEHAYEIDFNKDGKKAYLEVFKKIINWDIVSRRHDAILQYV